MMRMLEDRISQPKFIIIITFLLQLILVSTGLGGISVTPKYIFLDASKRMVPIYVRNTGLTNSEVSVKIVFGYVTSDDSGRPTITLDTLGNSEHSAAEWIKPYPERFILPAGENQTIRLVAYPPPGLKTGEYWARIMVTGKPQKATRPANPERGAGITGISFATRLGLSFHYRAGKVTTGLLVKNLKASVMGNKLKYSVELQRTGNSSYWGVQTIRLVNDAGRVVYTAKSNQKVYDTFFKIGAIDFTEIPAGRYTLTIEYKTSRRTDIRDDLLIQAPTVRTSTTVDIP